ncbi:MAG: hypothetical protein ABWK00_07145 [Desulfurococcaceae archaeon]
MSGEPEQEDQEAMEIYSRIRGLKPKRAGTYLGNEGEKYYVALSEEKVYELSPLAYYV